MNRGVGVMKAVYRLKSDNTLVLIGSDKWEELWKQYMYPHKQRLINSYEEFKTRSKLDNEFKRLRAQFIRETFYDKA